jgi:ATP-dependent DNA ligase
LDLIVSTDRGLYCAAGDFHVDPWRPVARAIITHAHSDHDMDAIVRRATIETFGPVRSVAPTQVFELGFKGIAPSKRHKSGVAVRFPRMLRWRRDKPVAEADTLDALRALLAGKSG